MTNSFDKSRCVFVKLMYLKGRNSFGQFWLGFLEFYGDDKAFRWLDLGPLIKDVTNQGGGLPKDDFANKAYSVNVMTDDEGGGGQKYSKYSPFSAPLSRSSNRRLKPKIKTLSKMIRSRYLMHSPTNNLILLNSFSKSCSKFLGYSKLSTDVRNC